MNDLNIINKKNAEAVAAEIPKLREQGKFVVAKYAGVSFFSHTAHDTRAQAEAEIAQIAKDNNPGERAQLLEPIDAGVYVATGDASPSLADLATQAAAKRAANEKTFATRAAARNPTAGKKATPAAVAA